MATMRLSVLLVALVLSAASVAPQQQQAGPVQPPQPAVTGTCEGACGHYLQCKGVNDAATQQSCIQQCYGLGATPQDLAAYEQSDCASAIATVEGGGQQQGGGQAPGGTDCNGCVRDGNSCVWISQSNWGQGPYSGAVSSCDPRCCGL